MDFIRDRTNISSPDKSLHFWPGFIDVFVSILMIFFLIAFLRLILNTEAFEMLRVRSCQEQFIEELTRVFEDEIKEGTIKIVTHGNLQQITFSSEILFESGDAELLKRGKHLLASLILIFDWAEEKARFKQIQVEGHTDNVPISGRLKEKFETNWELSAQRAINVVKFFHWFIEEEFVHLERSLFSANGYADQKPVVSNDTLEGRALNRRIEIRLIYFSDLEKEFRKDHDETAAQAF